MRYLNALANLGVQYGTGTSERRSIYLSNVVGLILFAAVSVLAILYYAWYGIGAITFIIPSVGILALFALALNYFGFCSFSRIWLSVLIPATALAVSIYSKTIYYHLEGELDYFTFRVVILASCVFPPVFFSLKEKIPLALTSFVILLILVTHDALHELFGVPYRSATLNASSYAFSTIVFVLMYMLMTGTVLSMKWISEQNESRANNLIDELNEINQKLTEKNREIENQNQEILTQTDKLNTSRRKLKDAYQIIEEQRNLLYQQNKNMSLELVAKNEALTETNNELIKHNNELRQFSYTVSHNLRGPVASLMGLLKLFQAEQLSPDNVEIFHHIETSTQRLDTIIKDLSKIIDIRNDIFQIRQQIDVAFEVQEILSVLNREIISQKITVRRNFESGRVIYSVRPMIHSILYNLISNAIKYRSEEREPVIEIKSGEDTRYYHLQVMDNGLGIDLSRDGDNIFKLYKRFHHHTEGKGLGLYLVKMQAEALGGDINVESEPNKFTRFNVRIRKPENAERQILYDDDSVEIFFDATLNCIGTSWRQPSDSHVEIILKKVLDFIKVYNTPNYLTDISVEGSSDGQGRNKLLAQMLREAATNGLRRIAIVLSPQVLHDDDYLTNEISGIGIELKYFAHHGLATNWIRNRKD